MSGINTSNPLELEEPDRTQAAEAAPLFNNLNEVYEINLQSYYASKKKAQQFLANITKQILHNKQMYDDEGVMPAINPWDPQNLDKVLDVFEKNKETSINSIKALIIYIRDNVDLDNRMLKKCRTRIVNMEEASLELATKGEYLSSALFDQQQQSLQARALPTRQRSPTNAFKCKDESFKPMLQLIHSLSSLRDMDTLRELMLQRLRCPLKRLLDRNQYKLIDSEHLLRRRRPNRI